MNFVTCIIIVQILLGILFYTLPFNKEITIISLTIISCCGLYISNADGYNKGFLSRSDSYDNLYMTCVNKLKQAGYDFPTEDKQTKIGD